MPLVVAGCSSTGADEGTRNPGQQGYVGVESGLTRIPVEARKAAPVTTGSGLDGKPLSTADYPGKVLVINIWGSWCSGCRLEAPALQQASDRTRAKAQFLGITTQDLDPAPALAFERANHITYPSIFDPDGKALLPFAGQYAPKAPPSTLILDPQGRLAARIIGPTTEATLVGLVDDVAGGK